ncbi:MAG: HD domain-containing protein [Magnetococcales bacterium]|nr:HD domain-containing protein [Magnetococcales bacterium]
MRIDTRINLFDLVSAITNALDLVEPFLVKHHYRVAYIGASLCRIGNLSRKQESEVLISSMLHDIGSITDSEKFEFNDFYAENPHRHSEVGFELLKNFKLFEDVSKTIRFHHVKWRGGKGATFYEQDVPFESHIVHLADRVDVLVSGVSNLLTEKDQIIEQISHNSDKLFHPEVASWFEELSRKEEFWLDLTSPHLPTILERRIKKYEIELTPEVLASFSYLVSQFVDFRSRFTSTHSSGVSATAEYIGRIIGFSEKECQKLMAAGFLHDIGKLAIPNEILEKPGKLTSIEFEVIKSHSYHTSRILESIKGIEDIMEWCSLHHEKLNGTGYPYREVGANIPLAATILTVSDIFTALTEDRPYRKGLSMDKVKNILGKMIANGELDERVVQVLFNNYDAINDHRHNSQEYAIANYRKFLKDIDHFEEWAIKDELTFQLDELREEKTRIEKKIDEDHGSYDALYLHEALARIEGKAVSLRQQLSGI